MRSNFASLPLLNSTVRLDGLRTAEELCLRLLDLRPLSREATGHGPSCLFYLDVLLSPYEDIPHLGDDILHQMFVKKVNDLQPTDEGVSGYVLATVVYQGHLVLKVIDIILQALSRFHLDREEMVVVLLEFLSRRKLAVEWSVTS